MPGMCFPNSRSYRGLGPDFLPPLLQRAIQQAVGSSLQGDLPNDKGMGSTSLLGFHLPLGFYLHSF